MPSSRSIRPGERKSGATPRPAEPSELHLSPYRASMQIALLRRHPQGAVEADRLAVEHRVGDDLADQAAVLLGAAEAGGEGDPLPKGSARLLGQRRQQRRVEEARGDG